MLSFALGDSKVPNANGFASQRYIGSRMYTHNLADLIVIHYLIKDHANLNKVLV